jgi:hypothetical protein
MTTAQAELKALQAAPQTIKVRDVDLQIRPIKFGQLHQVIELLGPALAELGGATPGHELLARHAGRLVPLVALLTGAERKWLEDLDLDEVAPVIAALVEANADFFVNRMAPALESAVSQISGRLSSLTTPAAASASAGPTPPNA